jgi:glycosyltransferase involved in cell wall biosynthesis
MHIYIFAPIRYDYLHQRPQKLADQFRLMSIPLTYIQPSGLNEYFSGNRRGLLSVLMQSLWYHVMGIFALMFPFVIPKLHHLGIGGERQNDIDIISLPVTFPINRVNSSILESLTSAVYRLFLSNHIHEEQGVRSVAIFENPFWGRVVEEGDFSHICYDCIDDVSIYAGRASLKRFLEYETALIRNADVVVATAALLEANLRARAAPRQVKRIPNGVDPEWFQTRASGSPAPDDLQRLKRPIVGYAGNVAGWMDYALIGDVARAMPEVSWVFVGPVERPERLKELLAVPNVHWLGQKPYGSIPAYMNAFDVCMIPFKSGSIAQTTNPVKLYEYFALGKPVVSTPLTELSSYVNRGMVYQGDSGDSFQHAVIRALGENDEQLRTLRKQTAQRHSWRALAEAFIEEFNTLGR